MGGWTDERKSLLILPKKKLLLNAVEWLRTPEPKPDIFVENLFGRQFLMGIIGPPKTMKSFTALQMAGCLAAGCDFLGLRIPGPRRAAIVQFEVMAAYYQDRLFYMMRGMGLTEGDIGDRLAIVNMEAN